MAIALDTNAALGSAADSLTVSYTCTGNNRLLLVYFYLTPATDNATGVTYNGVAMTQLAKIQAATAGLYLYAYGLLAPSTGSNSIVISALGGTIHAVAVSYTGVKQTGLPDAVTSATQASGPATFAHALTVVVANSWVGTTCGNGAVVPTVNTNITVRSAQDVLSSGDSNAAEPAGSFTQTWNVAASESAIIQVSFAPVAIAGAMFEVF